ncbi:MULTISPECIES: helix-turn-helix domain-containing protein [unclassified Frankia]|uniref:helix-turn-helix domain-containing protein n=1 Tax=unclassified Frankia TaxID=2632575 RepID=UPI002024C2F6
MDHAATRRRYCRCGARLARDNHGVLCAPCQRAVRDRIIRAPDVPPDFWESSEQLRDALHAWHMGRVIAAYRSHPYHHPSLTQATVAGWMGLTQTQLSRIESGAPITDLVKLIRWAEVLRIPETLLWFRLPDRRRETDGPAATSTHGRLAEDWHGGRDPRRITGRDVLPAATNVPMAVAAEHSGLANTLRNLHLPEEVVAAALGEPWNEPPAPATDGREPAVRPDPLAHDGLVRVLQAWADTVKRRQFLLSVGWAATAAAVPLLPEPLSLEPDRLLGALGNPSRVDAVIIGHIEEVLRRALGQDAALGPQAAIQTVLDQRQLARHLLEDCPSDLRPRLLSVYAGLCRATGWFIFDLGDFDAAVPHFEEGRTAAHAARNTELGALILCNLAQTAIWQDRPRLAVDHASAAVAWAWRTPDHVLRANAGDIAARAFAAAGDYDAAMQELHRAETALAAADRVPSLVDWYDEAFLAGIRGQCLLRLGRPAEAVAVIGPSLAAMDPAVSVRNLAMTTVDLATAYIRQGEVEEGARTLGWAGELAVRNRSARLATQLRGVRRQLELWKDSPVVRAFDEQAAALGVWQAGVL